MGADTAEVAEVPTVEAVAVFMVVEAEVFTAEVAEAFTGAEAEVSMAEGAARFREVDQRPEAGHTAPARVEHMAA
jgi:hypothetical protein